MELNKMEKRMLYQIEGIERYAILHEMTMDLQYVGNPVRKKVGTGGNFLSMPK